jgi:hypothetical protein
MRRAGLDAQELPAGRKPLSAAVVRGRQVGDLGWPARFKCRVSVTVPAGRGLPFDPIHDGETCRYSLTRWAGHSGTEVGKGATFLIRLPAGDERSVVVPAGRSVIKPAVARSAAGGTPCTEWRACNTCHGPRPSLRAGRATRCCRGPRSAALRTPAAAGSATRPRGRRA